MVAKRKNPADLTKRNNDARKKEITVLRKRVNKLESILMAFDQQLLSLRTAIVFMNTEITSLNRLFKKTKKAK